MGRQTEALATGRSARHIAKPPPRPEKRNGRPARFRPLRACAQAPAQQQPIHPRSYQRRNRTPADQRRALRNQYVQASRRNVERGGSPIKSRSYPCRVAFLSRLPDAAEDLLSSRPRGFHQVCRTATCHDRKACVVQSPVRATENRRAFAVRPSLSEHST